MKGWRVIDNTEIVLGPLWQERENERKHLKVLVQNVQQKLNDIQASTSQKEETIENQKSSLQHYINAANESTEESHRLRQELALLQVKHERTSLELSNLLASTKTDRSNLELYSSQIHTLKTELDDSRQMIEVSNDNEKLVRAELNEVYEKLRQKNTHHSILEKEHLKDRSKLAKLETQREQDQKRITYLLRKIDTLFHKLSVCRAKLDDHNNPVKSKAIKKVNDNATIEKLSEENTKLIRANRKKDKEMLELQKKLSQVTNKATDLKIALRNTKLSRDLLAKRMAQS